MPRAPARAAARRAARRRRAGGRPLAERDVQDAGTLLDLGDLMALVRARPARRSRTRRSSPIDAAGAARSRTQHLRHDPRRDMLVHHPFDSFSATVERFLEEAAHDDQVLAIKLTLYRTSGDTAIVARSSSAAQRGKQVAVHRRAQGALRRGEQHRLGAAARGRRRARRVRLGQPQDARQDGARRPPRARRHPALRPFRQRQLQFSERRGSTPTSACSPAARRSAPTSAICSTRSPATRASGCTASCSSRRSNMRDRFIELIEREAEHARAGAPGAHHRAR